ncbi:MAG: NADH-quinone oxidoreductase subunit [Thermoleophilaceae bacterium]|nr:NADH-quinone oxidoreductase subunit [Thermoleophilaceae bacterium]
MPDATGLELIAADVRERFGDDVVVSTLFFRDRATLEVQPDNVHDVLAYLKLEADEPYEHLMSLHGADYLPEEPRLGVHYELLSTKRVERLNVKTRVTLEAARLATVTDLFPTANFQEREVFDMFGIEFEGHPDHRRILMPEDYEGFPQRRDFPIGGEPVIFTFNENEMPRWYD